MQLREIIKQYNSDTEEKYCIQATVTAVDKTANTCDVEPLDGGPELFDVMLQAESGKGVVYYPKVGSTVHVSFLDKDHGYVSLSSELELVSIETENENLKQLLSDLITEITKITVPTPTGPSGLPVNTPQFQQIISRLDQLFK